MIIRTLKVDALSSLYHDKRASQAEGTISVAQLTQKEWGALSEDEATSLFDTHLIQIVTTNSAILDFQTPSPMWFLKHDEQEEFNRICPTPEVELA